MEIQSIQEKDLHHLGELMASSYGDEWTPAQCERYLAKFFKFEPESCKMVVGDEGKAQGAIFAYSYYKKDQLILFIQELFVDQNTRNSGIGKKLVSSLRESFTENPRVKITPLVNAPTSVLNFYNSLGFESDTTSAFVYQD